MDFKTFLELIKEYGFGAVFNTYDKHFEEVTWTFCFLMITEKGNSGFFMKQECRLDDFDMMLDFMAQSLANRKAKKTMKEEKHDTDIGKLKGHARST